MLFDKIIIQVSLLPGAAQSSLVSVERYDPRTNTWTMVAPMNVRRSLLNVAVLDGEKIYHMDIYDYYFSKYSILILI